MNYKEIGEQIFKTGIQFVESRVTEWGILLNDEQYLERLTYSVITDARKYSSPLVLTTAKEKLREYLTKYTSYRIDQEEIIEHYLKKADEELKLKKVNEKLEKIDVKDLSMIDTNIKELQQIKSIVKNDVNVVIHDGAEVLKDNLQNGFSVGGVPSGLDSLDSIIYGFKNEELTIIAARPGVGKTAMMCQFMSNMSKTKRIGVFSCEMSAKIIMNRVTACETGIDSIKLAMVNANNYAFLTNQEKEMVCMKAESIERRIIKLVDEPNIPVDLLCEKAVEMVKDYDIEIIMIDYLQLLTCDIKESRVEQISYCSRRLKGLSRTIKRPVISLAQLNRNADNVRPALRDLKGSGSIEEDSDMVIFLHEPQQEKGDNMATEIIVEKNRNGKTGFTKLIHNKPISRFTKWMSYE